MYVFDGIFRFGLGRVLGVGLRLGLDPRMSYYTSTLQQIYQVPRAMISIVSSVPTCAPREPFGYCGFFLFLFFTF
jgi:hypothetical protein